MSKGREDIEDEVRKMRWGPITLDLKGSAPPPK